MKTVAVVPIKLNNKRFANKNIRSFTNGKPLIFYILETLRQVDEIDEIYVYCSSETIKEYLPNNVIFLKRDRRFDADSIRFNDILVEFALQIEADTYVLTHATAPFLSAETIKKAIMAVNDDGYDSSFTVRNMKEFMWESGNPINYSLDDIPRTQDLNEIQIETCGLYVYARKLIIEEKKRIGRNSKKIPISKIEACDINTEEDFILADAVYNYFRMKNTEVESN